jgi:transcriptional regulator with XRE-family HTH domain
VQLSVIDRSQVQKLSNPRELETVGLEYLEPFLDKEYRDAYIDGFVKGRIAIQIRAIREKLGLSQKEFGDLIGKPQSVVSRLENTEYGGVNINTLVDIAKSLDIALDAKFSDYFAILQANLSEDALLVDSIYETYQICATGRQFFTTATPQQTTAVVMIHPSISIVINGPRPTTIAASVSGGVTW